MKKYTPSDNSEITINISKKASRLMGESQAILKEHEIKIKELYDEITKCNPQMTHEEIHELSNDSDVLSVMFGHNLS